MTAYKSNPEHRDMPLDGGYGPTYLEAADNTTPAGETVSPDPRAQTASQTALQHTVEKQLDESAAAESGYQA